MSARISVIICAAGTGARAGFDQNKLLVPLLGIPALERSLSAFAPFADQLLIAINPRDKEEIAPLASKYGAKTVLGGNTRAESVYNALKETDGEIVLVHDGARPFISGECIRSCIESVKEHTSGVCAIPVVDTVVARKDGLLFYPDRKTTYAVQTPQGFLTAELRAAYEKAFSENRTDFTDDSSLFTAYVRPATFCKGDKTNRKLTYKEDFFLSSSRVGFGVDTHAFGKRQDYIALGGVRVPSESGLIAHSDGDVLVHALMDALLSAAGLKDIGHYFPDSDEKWKNANSMEMLAQVATLIAEQGFAPANVSVAIQAEKPRLAKYIDEIRQSLALALSLPVSAVGVSAGTNEKLGYVGEGKGITVYATVLLQSMQNT